MEKSKTAYFLVAVSFVLIAMGILGVGVINALNNHNPTLPWLLIGLLSVFLPTLGAGVLILVSVLKPEVGYAKYLRWLGILLAIILIIFILTGFYGRLM
ncbi:MAG: hypothetical protein JXB14_00505 [Candidatus Altiarchaeota archaeon]|nr:hypothetical protein [Candidatus Altiarchaeota archaeon]